MQYHLNGYTAGDPHITKAADNVTPGPKDHLPEEVDVLIVGCGPAGLTLAAQLAAFPHIKTCIAEQKSGPLQLGQADGIACRTVEMFEAFGFSERVLKEAYWVNETAFWKPSDDRRDQITRSNKIQDTEEGLSEFPHVILNQARVHDFFLDVMRNAPSRLEPVYSRSLTDLKIDPQNKATPVTATFEVVSDAGKKQFETVKARYIVGCDGARSKVRQFMKRNLHGDSANQAWGVMDVLATTDFPDIRLKTVIQSANEGNMLIIPREGGYMVRFYIELDKLNENERVASRNITSDHLIKAAERILHPYSLDVKEVAWWSVYEIGQRLCDKFDDVPDTEIETRYPHCFIAGDACHTHSPKAGQGMNVSMRDSFNLGWKLAAVLSGTAHPKLLHTYSAERQGVAKELIDFDREFAKMFSAPTKTKDSSAVGSVDPKEFQAYFVKYGRFTAGTAIQYHPSLISAKPKHQGLAAGFEIGTRFHSAPVVCLGDAKPIHLGHTVKADGRWRLFAFCPDEDPAPKTAAIHKLGEFLEAASNSPVVKYTPKAADIDGFLDVRAVLQTYHRDLALEDMPPFFRPKKGKYGLVDYEKVFCADVKSGEDIFEMRGVDRRNGCLVLVRPDQHVANILPYDGHTELAEFFETFMISQT